MRVSAVPTGRCASIALEGPPVFVGDETSLGLLLALPRPSAHGVTPVATLLEVVDADGSDDALSAYGIEECALRTRCRRARRLSSAASVEAVRARADATLVLTGRAQTIAALRPRAEGGGARRTGATLVKAYWDEHRKGLD